MGLCPPAAAGGALLFWPAFLRPTDDPARGSAGRCVWWRRYPMAVSVADGAIRQGADAEASRSSVLRSFLICLFYGLTSVSITFFNKAIFAVYEFNFPCVLTLLQISLCLLFLTTAHLFKLITLPRLNLATAWRILPLTLCWWTYVITGIVALKSLNIPLFSTLRKLTALIVLLLETTVLGRSSPARVWASVSIMVCGGLLAGATDAQLSLAGYLFVGVCCVATALYLVLIVRVSAATALDTWGLLLYNNILSAPLMLLSTLALTDELSAVQAFPYRADPRFLALLLAAAAQATLLNVAIFLCTKANSPLATTVTGQIKDVATVALGLVAFGGVQPRRWNRVGLAVALFGSFLYSVVKYRIMVAAARRLPGAGR